MFKLFSRRKLRISLVVLMGAQMAVLPLAAYADSAAVGSAAGVSSPAPVSAPDQPSDISQAIPLAEAINAVKNTFAIPANFSDFTSSFGESSNGQVWNLRWGSKGSPSGNASAQVDAATGVIERFNLWKENSSGQGLQVPKLSKAAAQEKAAAFVKNLLPDQAADLALVDSQDSVVPINVNNTLTYQFKWERKADGIPVLGDGVILQMDANDGTILSYELDWTEGTFSGADQAVGNDAAKQAFIEAQFLKLKYFQAPVYRILKTADSSSSSTSSSSSAASPASGSSTAAPAPVVVPVGQNDQPVQLVYGLTSSSYGADGAIDALTGKPLKLEEGTYIVLGSNGSVPGAADQGSGTSTLTPEEQAEVDENNKLITKEQAAAAVAQLTGSVEGLVLRSANLYYDPSTKVRIWSLQWADNTGANKPEQLYTYVSANVNALTGELWSYYAGKGTDNEGKDTISLDAAQKAAEAFLNKVQPQRLAQAKLDQEALDAQTQSTSLPYPNQSYGFSYQRLVNDIVFPNNGLSVSIDSYTGEVVSYNLTWNDQLTFPAPAGLLSSRQAVDKFLTERPLTLSYVKTVKKDGQTEMRLIYLPKPEPFTLGGAELLDAKTGELLNYDGTPITAAPKAVQFTDIAGLPNEQEIAYLGQAGLFGEYGTVFRPDENVTLLSFFRAMYAINNGGYSSQLSDEDLLAQVKSYGWLKEDLPATAFVDRELTAKITIRMLGYAKLADLAEIYQVPYQDAGSISSDAKGYVALAWALGIEKVDGQNFEPQHDLTRAEAVSLLFNAYNVNK